jgi:ubiquitin-conjugating enzyme E2 variant
LTSILWLSVWIVIQYRTNSPTATYLFICLSAALFLADIVSGLVHWATDTWFDEIISPRVISIAREHHLYPCHVIGYPFRDYVGFSCWPTVLLIGPVGLLLTLVSSPTPLVFYGVLVCWIISVIMIFGTHAHRLGHRESTWRIVKTMQACHILLTPRHHSVHHRENHDIRYCVINGWANFVLDYVRFWRALEQLVYWSTGADPRRNDREWFARKHGDPMFLKHERERADGQVP